MQSECLSYYKCCAFYTTFHRFQVAKNIIFSPGCAIVLRNCCCEEDHNISNSLKENISVLSILCQFILL